jgi:hypothetical protein
MHKSATKCNETLNKWRKNKHGASKIIDTFETYHRRMSRHHPLIALAIIFTLEHERPGRVPVAEIGQVAPS